MIKKLTGKESSDISEINKNLLKGPSEVSKIIYYSIEIFY